MVLYCLGDIQTWESILSTQRARVNILGPNAEVSETIDRETPDHIALQGFLQSGALLSVYQRGGPAFRGTPGLDWRIYCETGEIRVTVERSYPHLANDGIIIELHDHAKDTTREVNEEIDVQRLTQNHVSPVAEVEMIYEAFAVGDGYAEWSEALQRHEMLDGIRRSVSKQVGDDTDLRDAPHAASHPSRP